MTKLPTIKQINKWANQKYEGSDCTRADIVETYTYGMIGGNPDAYLLTLNFPLKNGGHDFYSISIGNCITSIKPMTALKNVCAALMDADNYPWRN